MKKLLIVAALATLVATPTFAATQHSRAVRSNAATNAYAAAPGYAYTGAYAGSPVVVVDGKIIGADPDPNVRLQLLTQPSYNQ